jgi:hypothetical protein
MAASFPGSVTGRPLVDMVVKTDARVFATKQAPLKWGDMLSLIVNRNKCAK